MRILTDADVRALLPPLLDVVDLCEEGLRALAEGRVDVRPKQGVRSRPGMFADAMPAAHPERGLLGMKWISIAPDNPLRGLPTANGLMVLSDGESGVPTCVMPASELTAVRTAAVTGACVRRLARPGPVAILGAGVQARSHARVLAALGWPQVRVWGRRGEAVAALVRDLAEQAPGLEVTPMPSREATVRDASVVITALSIGLTDTRLPPAWLPPEVLLLPLDYASSIGPDIAESALLASDDLVQFAVVRDARSSLGPYPTPSTWTGHLLAGPAPTGRVVCVNLGSAVNDLLVASAIARAAERAGAGTVVEM